MFSVFRSPNNPFIAPTRSRSFEAIGAFNPSVVSDSSGMHVFYRAMAEPDELRTPGRGFSTIGYATSCDGGATFISRKQLFSTTETWEAYGCEDPRATFFEGKWYVFYTALGGYPFGPDNIRTAVAIGDAPDNYTEKHLMAPFNAKAATLFPERINGEAVLLITAHTDFTEDHPRPTIGIARSKNIADFWNPEFWIEWHAHLEDHAFPDVRRADSEHMEIGAAPLLTDKGWLLVYSHIQKYYDEHNRIFGIEALLLDREDPRKILMKTEFPFLVPEESYERYGIVSNVVFPSGALVEGDKLQVFYGGADTVCATAQLSLSHLLSSMDPEERVTFLKRDGDQPILAPMPDHEWESVSVSNAAAIDLDGSVHLVYRAANKDNYSMLGYARLEDGLHVSERLPEPIYGPREGLEFESKGTEDPRLTILDDTVYLTYTAFDGSRARGALTSLPKEKFLSHSFDWPAPFVLTPESTNDKDLCILPERLNGKAILIHRLDPNISAESIDLPPTHSTTSSTQIMGPRRGMWDAEKIGAAAPPIRVPEGWLFIYHGVGPDFHYRLGAALLDAETASIVLSRTSAPILSPMLPWEKEGVVNNVIFSCGAVLRDDTLFIYYGGADTAIGVATISKTELVSRLLPKL
jgi:predicted GH43/DUF377 family glycosyl hydrolase